MTEREAGTEIMMRLPDQSLKLIRVFIEASKFFIFNFLFDQAFLKFLKPAAHGHKELIHKASQKYSFGDPVHLMTMSTLVSSSVNSSMSPPPPLNSGNLYMYEFCRSGIKESKSSCGQITHHISILCVRVGSYVLRTTSTCMGFMNRISPDFVYKQRR
jgi:hypothetical protein